MFLFRFFPHLCEIQIIYKGVQGNTDFFPSGKKSDDVKSILVSYCSSLLKLGPEPPACIRIVLLFLLQLITVLCYKGWRHLVVLQRK